ncbi:MAG: peptidoglycan DD-metalloendopeptidase family protein, partial [Gemmatimonadaceae bacterium]|nr:peptidoglycan DD-metalloendopeptidase family protein [Gemmatimonadaceae bacterium]
KDDDGRVADSAGGSIVVDMDSVREAAKAEGARAHAVSAPAPATAPVVGPIAARARRDTSGRTPPTPAPDGHAPAPTPEELRWLAASIVVPVQGVRTSELRDSFTEARGGGSRSHEALDIPAPRGTPVLSAANGTLRRLFTSKDGGLMIYASDASDRFILMYAHLDRYADGMADGIPLKQGQIIGYVGTTGNAPPNLPHLHFALARGDGAHWWKGVAIDPYPLLTGKR